MKRAFIHAYMEGNLGDDLMVRILCERYPNVRFLLYADASYKERYKDIKNLKVYSPIDKISQKVNRAAEKIKKTGNGMWKLLIKLSDVTVHIGGSVFVQHQDNFKPAYDLDYDLRQRSKKMYVVGANFGPFTDEKYYEAYQELFKQYDGICFRDRYSKGLFQEYSNISYAPDVVFNYQFSKAEQRKEAVFSVIAMENRGGKYSISQYAKDYYRVMAEMMRCLVQKGYKIHVLSFCKLEGDEEAIEKILALLSEQERTSIDRVYYDKDQKQILSLFAKTELVIGTRFHSVILGWLAGKKVLPIVYNPKTRHTLEDQQCKCYLDMKDMSSYTKEDIRTLIDELEQSQAFDASSLIRDAGGQFAALDKALG